MIQYKIYNYPDHCLTYSAKQLKFYSPIISSEIKELLISWDVAFADKIIIAYDDNKIIGFFRYDLGNYKHNLYEAGTYVDPEYRGKGLGFSLWEQVFELEKPELVYGHVESVSGLYLLNKIKSKYNKVKYDFTVAQNLIDKLDKAG